MPATELRSISCSCVGRKSTVLLLAARRGRHDPEGCRVAGSPQEGDNRAMTRRPLSAIVLAAGEGTRMRSRTPKPLHRLCGRPMVVHVLDALGALSVERVAVVVGHGATEVVK